MWLSKSDMDSDMVVGKTVDSNLNSNLVVGLTFAYDYNQKSNQYSTFTVQLKGDSLKNKYVIMDVCIQLFNNFWLYIQ